jgi:hypothetical protein
MSSVGIFGLEQFPLGFQEKTNFVTGKNQPSMLRYFTPDNRQLTVDQS